MASTPSAFSTNYGPWAMVTGASSGIGAQFCRSLAARGLNVILIARRVERLEALAVELKEQYPVKTHVVQADLMKKNAAAEVGAAVAGFDIGLLVNNAGVEHSGSYLNATLEEIERLIALNVVAMSQLARVVSVRLAKRGRGGIIFVSSLGARPWPYGALYASSKAFITTLSVSLRYELQEYGVECLAFEPGFVVSEMSSRVREELDRQVFPIDMMPTEEAVENCLSGLGKEDVHTLGWKYRVFKFFMDSLPFWMTLPSYSKTMKKALPADKVKITF